MVRTSTTAALAAALMLMAPGVNTQAGPSGARQAARAYPVALADLAGRASPLASQDLSFDARFAELALDEIAAPNAARLARLAELPATQHILRHARQFDYADVAKESPEALVRSLLGPGDDTLARVARCRRNLEYVSSVMLRDVSWVADVLKYLPGNFRFHGSTLFFTYGYDIGVALAPTASLNLTHSKFDASPRELVYYAIHELHHVGFMTYQPPRRLADLRTCADVLRFIDYATQMEGMAVYAAYERRRLEHALADGDYVALSDADAMARTERRYEEIKAGLKRRGDQPADADAMKAIGQMSGERLWYRVGAQMAARIDERSGRARLTALIKEGPDAFLVAYRDARAR
jgi:hypothetical protein